MTLSSKQENKFGDYVNANVFYSFTIETVLLQNIFIFCEGKVTERSSSVRRYNKRWCDVSRFATHALEDEYQYDEQMNNPIDYDKNQSGSIQLRLTIGCCDRRI